MPQEPVSRQLWTLMSLGLSPPQVVATVNLIDEANGENFKGEGASISTPTLREHVVYWPGRSATERSTFSVTSWHIQLFEGTKPMVLILLRCIGSRQNFGVLAGRPKCSKALAKRVAQSAPFSTDRARAKTMRTIFGSVALARRRKGVCARLLCGVSTAGTIRAAKKCPKPKEKRRETCDGQTCSEFVHKSIKTPLMLSELARLSQQAVFFVARQAAEEAEQRTLQRQTFLDDAHCQDNQEANCNVQSVIFFFEHADASCGRPQPTFHLQ